MVARQSAKGIIEDACLEIIAKTGPHKKLKEVKDAAQVCALPATSRGCMHLPRSSLHMWNS